MTGASGSRVVSVLQVEEDWERIDGREYLDVNCCTVRDGRESDTTAEETQEGEEDQHCQERLGVSTSRNGCRERIEEPDGYRQESGVSFNPFQTEYFVDYQPHKQVTEDEEDLSKREEQEVVGD